MQIKMFAAAAAAIALSFARPFALAQTSGAGDGLDLPRRPGKHVAFLKWLDHQDRMSSAAGIARDSFMPIPMATAGTDVVVYPVTTEVQDALVDLFRRRWA